MTDSSIRVRRILHAGYVFENDSTKIIFDPIFENPFSVNCFAFPSVRFDTAEIKKQHFDAIFISHYHDDHCSLESLDLLDRNTPVYLFCIFDELFDMLRELGFKEVYRIVLNEPINVGSFRVIPREAEDSNVDCLFEIHSAGLKILNVVDALISSKTLLQLESESPWDLVLWPFQSMRETDVISPRWSSPWEGTNPAVDQLRRLRPRYVAPSSCQFIHEEWSWYNQAMFPVSYRLFEAEVMDMLPTAQVNRLDPAESVELRQDAVNPIDKLHWVSPLETEIVDFRYLPDAPVPPTCLIAKRFPSLTLAQSKAVQDFCQTNLLERFRTLEWEHADYFVDPQFWQLSVYDEQGTGTNYFYHICKTKIEKLFEKPILISWSTEVPAFKLFRALYHGESLTSMYVRINDIDFQPHLFEELRKADVMDDPLIRCLFTASFGAYQREQLKNLKLKKLAAPQR